MRNIDMIQEILEDVEDVVLAVEELDFNNDDAFFIPDVTEEEDAAYHRWFDQMVGA